MNNFYSFHHPKILHWIKYKVICMLSRTVNTPKHNYSTWESLSKSIISYKRYSLNKIVQPFAFWWHFVITTCSFWKLFEFTRKIYSTWKIITIFWIFSKTNKKIFQKINVILNYAENFQLITNLPMSIAHMLTEFLSLCGRPY